MPILRLEKPPHDGVGRDWVADHLDRAEPEPPVRISRELAAQVIRLLRVLVLVKADRRGVPDIDLRTGDRTPGLIHHARIHEQGVARRIGSG